MPREFARSERMSSLIQRELAIMIQHGLKDPRLASASPSILDVEVSKDLSQARIFFSVFDPEDAPGCVQAFDSASGFLQRQIGKAVKSRITPRLKFVYDDTSIRGQNLSSLIDRVIANDESKMVNEKEPDSESSDNLADSEFTEK